MTSYLTTTVEKAFAMAERLVSAVERIAESVEALHHDVATLSSVVTEVDSPSGRSTYNALMTTQP